MKLSLALLATLAVASSTVVRCQYTNTSNQLLAGNCAAITVIYARGTEDPGNVGQSVGPPFFDALAGIVGESNLVVQGVNYAAAVATFPEGGDPVGSHVMANLVPQAAAQCPGTKIVMSGYSQGGQLVHNAAKMLNTTETDSINSVVIFGDPYNGTAVGSIPAYKVKVICHPADDICHHQGTTTAAHLDYAENATQAADFVVERAGLFT